MYCNAEQHAEPGIHGRGMHEWGASVPGVSGGNWTAAQPLECICQLVLHTIPVAAAKRVKGLSLKEKKNTFKFFLAEASKLNHPFATSISKGH